MNAHSQKPQKTTRAISGVLDQILGYARRIAAKSETVGASGWPRMRTLNGHTVLKAIARIVAGSAAENFLERLDAMALIGETRYLGQGVVGDFLIEMRGDVVEDATSHSATVRRDCTVLQSNDRPTLVLLLADTNAV